MTTYENAIYITTTNRISVIELRVINGSMLEELQHAVGGWIEIVRGMYLPDPLRIVCNEEGHLQGISLNRAASLLYGSDIVGNVLLVAQGWRGREPDIVGLTDGLAEEICSKMLRRFPFLRRR